MGLSYDWSREVATCEPAYYKWTQWLFLQLFHAGKAYRKKAAVNWCPNDKTVLANEQVINGACERCGAQVEQRFLEQWFFRITDYAERLLANLDDREKMDWSDSTTTAQRNWIGRSEGAEIEFASPAGPIRVFTTRPDTLFGATFMVLAPEHPLVERLTAPEEAAAVREYRRAAAAKDIVSRRVGEKDKTGVFTGGHATNPATGQPVPVWIADYVLMEYGTGAIMGVPAHDERDFAFALLYRLPIVRVLAGANQDGSTPVREAEEQTDGFRLVNSGQFSELPAETGFRRIVAWLEEEGHGRGTVQYRLYDWCISRQRYWGPPIPVINCHSCGAVPVPEQDLPVLLPEIPDFQPDDSGISPLARHKEWFEVPCPRCGGKAHRETDVSDTFLDSAWYYLRYLSTELADRPFHEERVRRWLPVTMYIGGNEHAVLHLLYSRFIAMVLHDRGLLHFEEPFRRFRAHGTITKDGAKMSKSRGNVVIPDQYIARWGADTFRTYLMFLGPYQEGGDFRDEGLAGPRRFLDKVWELVGQTQRNTLAGVEVQHPVVVKWHQTIKRVTQGIEGLSYNTAIAALMELLNTMRASGCTERRMVKDMVIMLAPFAPHFAEECWERLGGTGTVFEAGWPEWEESLTIELEVEIPVQVNGKTRSKIRVPRGAEQPAVVAIALSDPQVSKFFDGQEPSRVIYVKDRLLNLVG